MLELASVEGRMRYDPSKTQKIEDCRELYLKYEGEHHELIEKEMRRLGYHDFHRRSLYRRFERGRCRSGWIERYGWNRVLKDYSTAETLRRREEEEKESRKLDTDCNKSTLI